MGRFTNVKVATFSKKINLSEIEPEFQYFDAMITHREGNYVTMVSHEYYRPSYRTRFRRPGRKNNRNVNLKQQESTEHEDSVLEHPSDVQNICEKQGNISGK